MSENQNNISTYFTTAQTPVTKQDGISNTLQRKATITSTLKHSTFISE